MLRVSASVSILLAAIAFVACTEKTVQVAAVPTTVPDAANNDDPTNGSADAAPEGVDSGVADAQDASGGPRCTAARKTHLGPIAKVSTGEVSLVSSAAGVKTFFIDASAGGASMASVSPRVYVTLSGSKVAITDDDAFSSMGWDLALKRVDIYTNSGDAGPGKGGAVRIAKAFDSVTIADANGLSFAAEKFFDEECEGIRDEASFIVTTCGGWYDYEVGQGLAVKPNTTLLVRAADGQTRYKVEVVSYMARADGSPSGGSSGQFLVRVAQL